MLPTHISLTDPYINSRARSQQHSTDFPTNPLVTFQFHNGFCSMVMVYPMMRVSDQRLKKRKFRHHNHKTLNDKERNSIALSSPAIVRSLYWGINFVIQVLFRENVGISLYIFVIFWQHCYRLLILSSHQEKTYFEKLNENFGRNNIGRKLAFWFAQHTFVHNLYYKREDYRGLRRAHWSESVERSQV